MKPEMDAEQRFWSHVQKSDGCWLWTAFRGPRGYGRTQVGERDMQAHRRSWELTNGPIPAGMHVCHHCDNPPCVRPDHLFLGTHADNMNDMYAKGRSRHAKLTPADILEIRRRAAAGETTRALGLAYGVHSTTVWEHIQHGKRPSHA